MIGLLNGLIVLCFRLSERNLLRASCSMCVKGYILHGLKVVLGFNSLQKSKSQCGGSPVSMMS